MTRFVSQWNLSQADQFRVVVISPELARAHPETAGLVGQVTKFGNSWLIVLPEQANAEQISEWLTPVLMDGRPVQVWEYFGQEQGPSLQVFDIWIRSESVRALAPQLLPVVVQSLAGKPAADFLRQIVANLRGVAVSDVSDADVQSMQEAMQAIAGSV